MPRPSRQLVGTLGHLVKSGHDLTVHCKACQHRAQIDLAAKIRANGEHYRVHTFIERAVCSKCGARWPKLSVAVTPVPATGYRKD